MGPTPLPPPKSRSNTTPVSSITSFNFQEAMDAATSLSKLLSALLLLAPPPPPSTQELPPPPRVPLPPKMKKAPFPLVANSNMLCFSSAGFNAQVTVQDNEPEERLLNRFRREVIRAGVFRECKKRRFFENKQDKKKRMGFISKKKKKRKARQAARRNKDKNNPYRSLQSRYRKQFKQQKPDKDCEPKRKEDSDDDDNWDFYEVDLPYN